MKTNEVDLDRVRGRALDRIDKARRVFLCLIGVTAVVEGFFLVLYGVLMNWDDRLHQLILVASLLIYWTLAACVLALGAYGNWMTQRLLKAIELIEVEVVAGDL
jgi:hypothetical protein